MNAAKEWLQAFYADGRKHQPISDQQKAQLQKKHATVCVPNDTVLKLHVDWMDSENIQYECAPFEADWQLVYLETIQGLDGIISTDGDLVILGARTLLDSINFNSRSVLHFDRGDACLSHFTCSGAVPAMFGSAALKSLRFTRFDQGQSL